jgi:predicted Zn-dependent peptidase
LFERTTLPNGVRVVTAPLPHSYSTAVSLYFPVGSRYEEERLQGRSHYLEHMLFKGTETRPSARAISETVEGVGGVLNAGTGREYTVYWSKLPAEHGERAFDLLADMVRRPLLDPEEVERERGVILEEIKGNEDSPPRLARVMLDRLLWPDQPLGREVAGTLESVGRLTGDDLRALLAGRYAASGAVVSCAGPVAHEEVVGWAGERLGDLQEGEREAPPPARRTEGEKVAMAGKPVKQASFSLGFHALSYRDDRRYALNVLDAVLGGGMSARLFLEVRERRGLAYSVGCYSQEYADDGAFVVHAGVAPDRLRQSVEAVFEQLERLCHEPLTDEELARIKTFIRGRTVMGLEGSRSWASWNGGQEMLRDHIREPEEALALVDAVTAEDVASLAAELFDRRRARLSVVGPFEDERELAPLLPE